MSTKLFAALLTVALSVGFIPSQKAPVEPVLVEPPQTVVQAQTPETQLLGETPAEVVLLTAREAEELVLQKAELTREQVKLSRTELDWERGVPHWEVEFRYEDWEYDYIVHAETGAVLQWDKEYEPQKTTPTGTQPPVTQTPAAPPTETEPKPADVTAEEAKALALAHAGLTAEQVGRVKVEKDREKGIWVYEVEFQNGRWEYDYEIHAQSGKILEWDKEYDD